MKDIVKRLRAWPPPEGEAVSDEIQLCLEAADEIERLRVALDTALQFRGHEMMIRVLTPAEKSKWRAGASRYKR